MKKLILVPGFFFALLLSSSCATPQSQTPAKTAVFDGYVLTGRYENKEANFTLRARAYAGSGTAPTMLLSGPVGLSGIPSALAPYLDQRGDGIFLAAKNNLDVELPFRAQIKESNGWKTVQFTPAAANIRQLVLEGWPESAKLDLPDASQAVRQNGRVTVNLPGSGPVILRWKDAPPETAGKLFFSVDGSVIDIVAPGILRQTNQFTFRILQGKLERIEIEFAGAGEITRVDGPGILNWSVAPGAENGPRKLTVQLNAPQSGQYPLTVQLEAPLAPLPTAVSPPRLTPLGMSSYGGRVRVQNDGTVRLEVAEIKGLSQIAPEQPPFPPATSTPSTLQVFAYRFADGGYTYVVRADNVLPEVSADGILVYHLGDTDMRIDAEFQLEIREAPLRELNILGPAEWSVAGLEAPNLADYFLTPAGDGRARLRLLFAQPLQGRQVVRLRLERNAAALNGTDGNWTMPPLSVVEAKNVRGYVAVTAEPSLRLTPGTSDGLNEAAPGTFPSNLANLQTSWRYNDAAWSATLRVEKLASSVQSEALQLFSVGEGLAYGSTVVNLNIAGAPVSVLRLRNTGAYRNVEFTGRNLRNWKQNGDVYEVYLNRPVSGAYTLLATFELPFKGTGDTLAFTGFQPLDVQSEQGHILVTSGHPFHVAPARVSGNLVRLEGPEVPAEFRLLSDAPMLACYQYTARPFDASLQIQPLADSGTVDQVVDIAELQTRVSSTGEIHTNARYLLKSKGQDHLQLSLPAGARLWKVVVAGKAVVPVSAAGNQTQNSPGPLLVPLPRGEDANTPLLVELEYASSSANAARLQIAAPVLHTPVLVTDWTLTPDSDRRLVPPASAPVVEVPRLTGLSWLGRVAFGQAPAQVMPMELMIYPPLDPRPTGVSSGEKFWGAAGLLAISLLCLWLVRGKSTLFKIAGMAAALGLAVMGLGTLVQLGLHAPEVTQGTSSPLPVRISVPVMQADTGLSYDFENAPAATSWLQSFHASAWLLLPGLLLLAVSRPAKSGRGLNARFAVGSVLLLTGSLGLPHGPLCFCLCLAALFGWLIVRALVALVRETPPVLAAAPAGLTTTTVVLFLAFMLSLAPNLRAAEAPPTSEPKPGLVLSITQNGTMQDGYARVSAAVTWRAEKGDKLAVLSAPAILTSFEAGKNDISLAQDPNGGVARYIVTANSAGTYKFSVSYQVRAVESTAGNAVLILPTPGGLVNEMALELARPDLEGGSDNAVSLRTLGGPNERPKLVASFPPGASPSVRWWPRARDLSAEKPVYYADWHQLFTPSAGIVDGRHEVQVRLAQGEVKQLAFTVPTNMTISNVQAEGLAAWRFDPDQHKLFAYFEPARKTALSLLVVSQTSAAPLPFNATLAPIRLDGAANEVGLLAVATNPEVQLGAVSAQNLSGINLDDFPAALVKAAGNAKETYSVRRAYSYGTNNAALKIEALAVEPDIRVESLQTLSLGEDRVVLAARLNVNVARAGIFSLSFALPAGLDLESISGPQLSHWTSSGAGNNRTITLNLKGKSMGTLPFNITLSGPGLSRRQEWTAPRLSLRGAGKETGQLALLPELGLRPHILVREGLTQIDPKEARINAEGALVFRLLQADWNLRFDVETIEPSIQSEILQDVTVREALTDVRANIDFQIENAGVRELRLQLPAGATGVRIIGAQVSDSLPVEGQAGRWLVRLQRRCIGALNLTVTYQLPPAETDNRVLISGIQTLDTTLQRGYVDLRARGRLETRVASAPAALQAADWEAVPASLRRDVDANAPSQIYRVVDPAFTLPVEVVRHQAAEILPARVVSANLRTLLSPDGQLLTTVTVSLYPSDKRHLNLSLPGGAKFWFAFVNDKGSTPSIGSTAPGEILIPLEPNPLPGEPATVEFLYEQKWTGQGRTAADLEGPRFDLPLANISWRLFLPKSWKLTQWSGPWQEIPPGTIADAEAWKDLDAYLFGENQRLEVKTQKARKLYEEGNVALQQGRQMQARELFNNAYQISQRDTAFNEDARVQWQNLREQQTMMGLANNANSFNNINVAGKPSAGGAAPAANPVLSQAEVLNFTDQDMRKLLGANAAEDNAVLAKLAERLVKQQAATLPRPAAIHATLPERGEVYQFNQAMLVNPGAPLTLKIAARPAGTPIAWAGIGALLALALGLAAAAGIFQKRFAA